MRHEHLIVAVTARDEVDSIGECIRAVDQGHRMLQSTKLRVLASARTHSRVAGGFATNLDKLDPQSQSLLAAHV